jgi:hypothetical protein
VSVALRGNVRDFGIAEVFQLIGQQRKSGLLEFTDEHAHIQVLFDSGRVVSAVPIGPGPDSALGEMFARCGLLTREKVEQLERESAAAGQSLSRVAVSSGALSEKELSGMEDLLTRETIFAVLRWESGSFNFLAQDVEHARDPDSLLGAEQILMDGLRMVDEWQSFAELVPSEDIVFRRIAGFDAYLQRAHDQLRRQREPAERVYSLIDGRLAVRRIVDLSLLGSFNAMRILADLRRAGVIEPLDPEEVERLRARRRPSAFQRSHAWTSLAACAPLALLAAVTLLVWRAPLESVRESYASRRVRHALESFRLARGRWPRDAAELEAQRVLASEALAPFSARAYYYSMREDGPLLLAPTR